MRDVLFSGRWGTISPKSVEAQAAIADFMDRKHGLCLNSAYAALEALLRSLDIGYGDEVIVASYSNAVDSMTVSCVGAKPVFCDIDYDRCTISVESVKESITEKTKAVIVDSYAGDCGDLDTLSKLCKENHMYLIENVGDELVKNKQATATVMDIGKKNSLNTGLAGALVTDIDDIYNAFYAYHNCGRSPVATDNLKVQDFVGGNMRIAEWQSSLVVPNIEKFEYKTEESKRLAKELVNESFKVLRVFHDRALFVYNGSNIDEYVILLNKKGIKADKRFAAMHKEPFFKSDYFKKQSGSEGIEDIDLPGVEKALSSFLWVYFD